MSRAVEQIPWVVAPELLRRFDVPGPRYTSYPTADRFAEGFGEADLKQALRERVSGSRVGGVTPLSVYVHIPFCESVCYYCACNKVVTRHHARAESYLADLETEIDLHVVQMGRDQAVSQVHFGGGSPTFFSDAELARVLAALHRAFRIQAGAEISIEVDPRTVDASRLSALWAMGFNRLSFGVQDFDPAVQQAIHRIQPLEQVRDMIHAARAIGFESLNIDLIYGLPRQTPDSFAGSLAQAAALRPDRVALYAYAHLPQRFKPQRRIVAAELPSPQDRVSMLSRALGAFLGQGYSYIGMDHFALPNDPLAVAKRQGRLHRNFQGYSTQPECDLIALGVSAIGRMGALYSQNAKTLAEYSLSLAEGRLPVVRGLRASRDDLVRRAVIMALMCQGRVDFDAIDLAHMVRFRSYFSSELERLQAYESEGLVEIGAESIELTPLGWFFVRALAMVFDPYQSRPGERARFSRII